MRIRECIYTLEELLGGEVEMDDFGGKRKGKRGRGSQGCLWNTFMDGKVKVVKDVSAESILRSAIKKVKRGSIIYTDRFRSYDGLVMYGFLMRG
jgi:transposase